MDFFLYTPSLELHIQCFGLNCVLEFSSYLYVNSTVFEYWLKNGMLALAVIQSKLHFFCHSPFIMALEGKQFDPSVNIIFLCNNRKWRKFCFQDRMLLFSKSYKSRHDITAEQGAKAQFYLNTRIALYCLFLFQHILLFPLKKRRKKQMFENKL